MTNTPARPVRQPTPPSSSTRSLKPSDIPIGENKQPCWTDCIPRTDHNALFLDYDFSSTTLGPKSEWGPALKSYTTMVFADSRGACLYWYDILFDC